MENKELQNIVSTLTESLIVIAQTAFYAHEMASACYEHLAEGDKCAVKAVFRKGVYDAGPLTHQRDELLEQLHRIAQRLKAQD